MKQVSTQAALQQGIEIMLPENGLTEKLQVAEREGRPLVVKLGFDPTAPDLHLGHAVVLRKLRQFQDAGHRIVVVIGDFTARIGDPTGKNKARPPLDEAQVQAHARTYTDQLSRILDMNRCDVCFNSSWLKDMGLERVIGLLSGTTLAQVLQRSDFQNRFRQQVPIVLHELMYPLLQGYDSLMIRADLEIGGTDQLFNCSMGRHLQESRGLPAQVVLCMPLLRGTDGSAKMSKSQGNTIGITEKPAVMFGKLMSVPDALLEEYLELASDFEPVQKTVLLQEAVTQPMQVKKILAENVTAQYHGVTAAAEARLFFEQQFQGRGFDDKAFEPVSLRSLGLEQGQELPLLDLCALLRPGDSRSVLRRLIEGGAVVLNGERWREAGALVLLESLPLKIRLGRLHYFALA